MSGRYLLLVEDDVDARASLERSLSREGYVVSTAATVEDAVRLAAAAAFLDAVVTDVVLGQDDRGGIRLIGALREQGVRAPIVLITAFAALSSVKQALNEAVDFCVARAH